MTLEIWSMLRPSAPARIATAIHRPGRDRHWRQPIVPDRNAVIPEIFDVGIAGQKPQQLVHDRFERQLLGGQHRESGGQIEAHLMAEDRQVPVPVRSLFSTPSPRIRSSRS